MTATIACLMGKKYVFAEYLYFFLLLSAQNSLILIVIERNSADYIVVLSSQILVPEILTPHILDAFHLFRKVITEYIFVSEWIGIPALYAFFLGPKWVNVFDVGWRIKSFRRNFFLLGRVVKVDLWVGEDKFFHRLDSELPIFIELFHF